MDKIEIRIELNKLIDEIEAIKNNQSRIAEKLYQFEDEFTKIPNSMLFNNSFMARAFSVWGYYFIVQLILAIPIVILMNIFS